MADNASCDLRILNVGLAFVSGLSQETNMEERKRSLVVVFHLPAKHPSRIPPTVSFVCWRVTVHRFCRVRFQSRFGELKSSLQLCYSTMIQLEKKASK